MQRVLLPLRIVFGQRDLVVLLACSFLLGLAYSFVGPFLSMFGTIEAAMKPWVFGVFMTITSISAVVVSTVLARWSDTHLSRRTVLVLGTGCGALGYLGYAFVRDVVWLTAIGSTVLAVSTITFSQLFAHAREVMGRAGIPAKEAPLYMNVLRLFFALAWTVGPAIASWVMIAYSYRGLFFVAAGVFFVLLLAILRFIPHEPPPAAGTAGRTSLRQSLARPDILAYFIAFVLIFVASTMWMMNLPLYVLKSLQGTEHDVGVIFSLAPVFELPLMFYFGMLASRGDQAAIIRTGVIIAAIYYAGLSLVGSPWHIYPLQLLVAAATAVTSGVAITFFQNYLPGQAGSATNLYATAQRIGSTVGYLLFGVLVTTFGHRGLFVVCALLSAGALGLLFVHHRSTSAAPVAA